jgi:tetratricopeptide (TPR) repeat protein
MPEVSSTAPITQALMSILNDPQRSNEQKLASCLEILKSSSFPEGPLDLVDESKHDIWNIVGLYFMRIGELQLAKSFYDAMRQWFLRRQDLDGIRYHKGTAYHNLGVALLGLGENYEARRNIMCAFIEDAITFQDPTGAPAYIALRQIFFVSRDFLSEVIKIARTSDPKSQLDPMVIYSKAMNIEGAPVVPPMAEYPANELQNYERRAFSINKNQLEQLLQDVEQARTNSEKKRSLELLSESLFGGIQGFTPLPSTRTYTGELDRIIRNENGTHPFLKGLGAHILVECKNWSTKVGANHIRIFLDKMDEHRCQVGVMLAKQGITGKGIREAKGRIWGKFQQNGIILMILSKGDIERIIRCENLIQIMKEKFEDVKFGRL